LRINILSGSIQEAIIEVDITRKNMMTDRSSLEVEVLNLIVQLHRIVLKWLESLKLLLKV